MPRPILTAEPAVVKGQMVERCTGEGCWFYVKDATGRIKVDTKAAGFNVRKIGLKSELVVAGKLRQDGDEMVLDATGLKDFTRFRTMEFIIDKYKKHLNCLFLFHSHGPTFRAY